MKTYLINFDSFKVTLTVIIVSVIAMYISLYIPVAVASSYNWQASPVRESVENICGIFFYTLIIIDCIYALVCLAFNEWQNREKAQAKKVTTTTANKIKVVPGISYEIRRLVKESEKACNIIGEELHKFTPDNNKILGAVAQLENIDHLFVKQLNTTGYNEDEKYYYNKYGRLHFSKYTYNKYIQDLYKKVYGYGAICFCSYVEQEVFIFPYEIL